MKFARNRDLRVWSQNQRAERVFVIHHVEEWEARIWTRSRQNLEERSVRVVIRILVAGTPRVTAAYPRFEFRQHFGLETGLGIDRSGALLLHAPAAGLSNAPKHQIDR